MNAYSYEDYVKVNAFDYGVPFYTPVFDYAKDYDDSMNHDANYGKVNDLHFWFPDNGVPINPNDVEIQSNQTLDFQYPDNTITTLLKTRRGSVLGTVERKF